MTKHDDSVRSKVEQKLREGGSPTALAQQCAVPCPTVKGWRRLLIAKGEKLPELPKGGIRVPKGAEDIKGKGKPAPVVVTEASPAAAPAAEAPTIETGPVPEAPPVVKSRFAEQVEQVLAGKVPDDDKPLTVRPDTALARLQVLRRARALSKRTGLSESSVIQRLAAMRMDAAEANPSILLAEPMDLIERLA